MAGYRHLFFDLDGTLTDSSEGITHSVAYAFEKLGLEVPAESELRKFIGPPLSLMFPKYGMPEDQVDEGIRLYRVRYNELGGKWENRPYEGIVSLLSRLKEAGFHLYVATSKPESMAREILEGFELAPYFEYIAGASLDRSRENKEDVIRYLLRIIAERNGETEKDGCVMIGDTEYDVLGAKETGLPCIGCAWGFGTAESLLNAGAEVVAADTEQLYRILFTENSDL